MNLLSPPLATSSSEASPNEKTHLLGASFRLLFFYRWSVMGGRGKIWRWSVFWGGKKKKRKTEDAFHNREIKKKKSKPRQKHPVLLQIPPSMFLFFLSPHPPLCWRRNLLQKPSVGGYAKREAGEGGGLPGETASPAPPPFARERRGRAVSFRCERGKSKKKIKRHCIL